MDTFGSKVDGWFVAAAAVTAAAGGMGVAIAVAEGLILPALISLIGVVVVVTWVWATTRYTITERARW